MPFSTERRVPIAASQLLAVITAHTERLMRAGLFCLITGIIPGITRSMGAMLSRLVHDIILFMFFYFICCFYQLMRLCVVWFFTEPPWACLYSLLLFGEGGSKANSFVCRLLEYYLGCVPPRILTAGSMGTAGSPVVQVYELVVGGKVME